MDTEYIFSIIAILFIIAIFYIIYISKKSANNKALPYSKKYLLTKNEWNFYRRLKPVADRLGYGIIAKIRLADLVEVDTSKTNEFGKFFSKISSKHIDFGLVNPENMEVKFLIELDDSSHDKPDRIERDDFVNKLCSKTGYVLIRTYGDVSEIEKMIKR